MDKYILSGLELYMLEIALSVEIDSETDEKSRQYKEALHSKLAKIRKNLGYDLNTATYGKQLLLDVIPRHENDIRNEYEAR